MRRRIVRVMAAAIWLAPAAALGGQIPAPPLEWGAWTPLTTCNGVGYDVAFSRYDGRNDVEVKVRLVNTSDKQRSTRFVANLDSDNGEHTRREGGARLNPLARSEGTSVLLGKVFETPVNQTLPTQVQRVTVDIETADVSVLPPYATPSTYLHDFVDFPKQTCHASASPPASRRPRFAALTEACYNGLPNWSPTCNQAVDALVGAYNGAPETARACMVEWRQFQKCYEGYAFDRTPNPAPRCVDKIPRCELPE